MGKTVENKMKGIEYSLTIHTGDEVCAGTDSNIFVTLFGTLGQSDEYRLNGLIQGNAFERNQTDTLSLELPEDIGDVYSIELRSDCMYAGADWLLDYILIKRAKKPGENTEPPTCRFSCRKWIKNKEVHTFNVTSGLNIAQNTKVITEVVPSGETLFVPAGQSITYSNKISIRMGYSLKETKISQTESNTTTNLCASLGLGGSNADTKTTALKSTIEFALKTLNSEQDEKQISFDAQKDIDITETISNESDADAEYEVMLNVKKNLHAIAVGGTLFEVPEYFSSTFAGVRKLK